MAVKAVPLGRVDGKSNFAQMDFIVTNSVTVTAGDFVYGASGRVTNASVAGQPIVGYAQSTVTGNVAGTNKVSVIIDPLMRYLIDNDNDSTTFAATHVLTKFNLIGATGAQLVDTSSTSATTGQLLCIEYNPQIDPVKTDTSVGIFVVAESALFPLGA
jgi:hypothetical protein